jgi:hypothetical protein
VIKTGSIEIKKIQKFIRSPGLFIRDYLLKRHPLILNELKCPIDEEEVLIRHELALHENLPESLTIDVVFTWVNDADPVWQKKLNHAKNNGQTIGAHAQDNARFANHDELRYSLKCILENMPWVNHIYIVTDQQRPNWLKADCRITIIDHKEIIDKQFLPTFNSHVIEACLHKIKGLAEHFIYFNDDVFVARPLQKNHFFKSNGIASLFLAQKSLTAMHDKGMTTPTLSAAQKGAKLLRAQYGETIDMPLVHTYVPLRKSMFELAWQQHGASIRQFMGNQFRGNNDLNLATFLIPWMAYFEGLAVPAIDICYYFNAQSTAAKQYWTQLHLKKGSTATPHSFCANDFRDTSAGTLNNGLSNQLKLYTS